MKKTYIIPATTILQMQTAQMIATSVDINGSYDGTKQIESRSDRNSFWDDDED